MNRFLAETLSVLNITIAVIIFAGSGWIGYNLVRFAGPVFGITVGLFFGFIAAALVCGTIAQLSLIERHLSAISRAVAADTGTVATMRATVAEQTNRQEPRL